MSRFSDFFTDVFVRSDPPEVPKQPLIGATCWVTLTYENGTTQTYGDWGAYIEYENKWRDHFVVVKKIKKHYFNKDTNERI